MQVGIRRYAAFTATKRGLATALHSGDPAFDTPPAYFRASFKPALQSLLAAARAAGDVRADVDAFDLLREIGNPSVSQSADHSRRMVDLLIDGLSVGAPGAGGKTIR